MCVPKIIDYESFLRVSSPTATIASGWGRRWRWLLLLLLTVASIVPLVVTLRRVARGSIVLLGIGCVISLLIVSLGSGISLRGGICG